MLLQLPLLGIIGMQEILVIAIVVLVLFGGRKIPELMRGLGSGIKSFKEGMNEPLEEKPEEAKAEAAEPVHDAHFHGSLFGLARCVALYFGRAVPFHHSCALRE